MAEYSATLTPPKTSVGTELWYSEKETPSTTADLIQIFLVQEIPTLKSAPEAVTYSCLESPNEGTARGVAKSETLTVPILFSEAQHDALKALADANTQLYFWVKLPDTTAAESGKPLTFKFSGTIYLENDTISNNSTIQENLTIYRDMVVGEQKGLPTVS
ncbi:MAG TPA: hypothetical protein DEP23_04720 [Ruminococcaceae bacterium]|nr:hypothetical protein [Oscillospiraceae bacterium]